MIIRQHGEVDLKHNPHVAAVEFKLLQLLHSVGLAVPTPYHLDQSGEIFSTPYVVMEYIEGKPEFAPAHLPDLILQLATHLSRIHQINGSKLDLSFLPQQEEIYAEKLRKRPAPVDKSLDEGEFEILWNQSGHSLRGIHRCCSMETSGQAISYGKMVSLLLSPTGRTRR